jgi:hypothetical protein
VGCADEGLCCHGARTVKEAHACSGLLSAQHNQMNQMLREVARPTLHGAGDVVADRRKIESSTVCLTCCL